MLERSRWRIVVLVLSCGLIGTLGVVPAYPGGKPIRLKDVGAALSDSAPSDTALFAAVLRELERDATRPLWVNPHPLITDPSLTWVGADDLAEVPASIIEGRRQVAAQHGLSTFSVLPFRRCEQGPGGLPPRDAPPPTAEAIRCVVVSLARPGGAHYPPDGIRAPAVPGQWTMRVATLEPGAYVVYDYVLEADGPASMWRVVQQEELLRVMS